MAKILSECKKVEECSGTVRYSARLEFDGSLVRVRVSLVILYCFFEQDTLSSVLYWFNQYDWKIVDRDVFKAKNAVHKLSKRDNQCSYVIIELYE